LLGHDIKHEDWKQANNLVNECIGLISTIGSLSDTELDACKQGIKTRVNEICSLIPVNKGDSATNQDAELVGPAKNKVGMTLRKALETIDAYINGSEMPQDDVVITD
jgi:hypothetical protein